MGRALCSRRRQNAAATAAFLHVDLPLSPPARAWASSPAVSPVPGGVHETIPIELQGASARAMYVVEKAASNLATGAIFGGLFGLISGGFSKRSLQGALTEARTNGRSWASISATYAGLQAASLAIRRKDDRVNNVVGACGSGAAFAAHGGPAAALQGCVSFAAISYLIEAMTTPKEEAAQPPNDAAILNKK